ncbi:hypothetical protein ACSSS7_004982 [Eimeria intestinalis]
MENGESRGSRQGGSGGSGSNSTSGNTGTQAPLTSKGAFDPHLYGETPVHQYLAEIPAEDEQPTPLGQHYGEDPQQQRGGGTASVTRLFENERRAMLASSGGETDAAALLEKKAIAAREDLYRRQRFQRALSPERQDPFAADGVGRRGDEDAALAQQLLQQQRQEEAAGGGAAGKRGRWDEQRLTEAERMSLQQQQQQAGEGAATAAAALASRWDTPLQAGGQAPGWGDTPMASTGDAAEAAEQKPKKRSRWDATPAQGGTGQETPTPGQWGTTPVVAGTGSQTPLGMKKRSRWDATPVPGGPGGDGEEASGAGSAMATPLTGARLADGSDSGLATPGVSQTPGATPMTSGLTPGVTPLAMTGLGTTPLTPGTPIQTPEQLLALRLQQEFDERNRYLTDEELDRIMPTEGYEIVQPPSDYNPPPTSAAVAAARARQQALASSGMTAATPGVAAGATPLGLTPMYVMPEEGGISVKALDPTGSLLDPQGLGETSGGVQMKAEDFHFFSKLFEEKPEDQMTQETQDRFSLVFERMLTNHHIADRGGGYTPGERSPSQAAEPSALCVPSLDLFCWFLLSAGSKGKEDPIAAAQDQEWHASIEAERHLLVKVIDRVLYKLDDLVRPYAHKILVVIEPLLIDEDYYARIEGREIISNLAKAAGLATMIATMRPDIDHPDEYVRNTTARAFAVVASALGVPSLLLFLKAVCQSKKSWQARHTGIKIIQQIAILLGCGVLPHLRQFVEIIQHGLDDPVLKIKTVTALALAALAEAAAPYGIEAFDCVLRPLWKGIGEIKGKSLAAYLKAIGSIIPLMDAYHASYYTREVMVMLVREFETNDEEMKKIVLRVVKQCVATEGVEGEYIRTDIIPPFFSKMWLVRNALDRRTAKLLTETATELASKAGGAHVIKFIVDDLKDPSEPFRKVIVNGGVTDVDGRLEEQLIDGLLYAFQEQTTEDTAVLLNGFSTIVNALSTRVKPYLPQICGVIRWRLNTPSAKLRQQAADLVARIATVMFKSGEEQMLGHLGLFLYEYLGEEYPDVLGSILCALKAIVNVIGMNKMTPPIKDLLPRLTPILKNRHEKVQENLIDLIGRIADRGGDLVSPKEWDRICFDLLDLLRAQKKSIRRATVNTFGYIARTIGPQDVLATLLNNLKMQERQLRLCTTIAIAIVAETCLPYSVLPALINEYRVPELNIQNGVLKTLSFMFEYIGEMAKDYIYTVTPLLEDALMDRDLVHRQTAAWACKHLALGVHGLSCEDALTHLFNYVWPNIFEVSAHMVQAFFDAVDGMRVAIGPGVVFRYVILGLFHPARKVRDVYWRVYNNVYIGHQDAMVAFFPRLPDDEKHSFARHELELVV